MLQHCKVRGGGRRAGEQGGRLYRTGAEDDGRWRGRKGRDKCRRFLRGGSAGVREGVRGGGGGGYVTGTDDDEVWGRVLGR
jgi:hypothetical protein